MEYVIEYQTRDHDAIEYERISADSADEAKQAFLVEDPDAIFIAIYEEILV